MTMSSTLVAAVSQAFSALGDLVGNMTVRQQGESYDPDTGILTKTINDTTVRAIVGEYEADDIDGTVVQAEDRRFFIKHITGLVINTGDIILDQDNNAFIVMAPKQIRPNSVTLLWDVRGRS